MSDETPQTPPVTPPPEGDTPAWLRYIPAKYRAWLWLLLAALLTAGVGALWKYWDLPGEPPPVPFEAPADVVPLDEGPVVGLLPGEAEPELTIRADQLAPSRDWGHELLGLQALHAQGYDGSGTTIAICDTGVDTDHPDLAGRIADGAKDHSGSGTGYKDYQGHGTHVAGIAAAGGSLIGAAPGAKILPMKVLGDTGSGSSFRIAQGIKDAADKGADVINLSLGGSSPDPYTRAAIEYAISKGVWVVAAAGNDGRAADNFPGHFPSSVAVAAVDRNAKRAGFSTINPENDVAAPGSSILSTLPGGKYGTLSGTSMATPYVAGSLAIVRGALKKANKPIPSQGDLLVLLAKHSKDIDPAGHDAGTGHGLIQPARLLAILLPEAPQPPPPPKDRVTMELTPSEAKLVEAVRAMVEAGRKK